MNEKINISEILAHNLFKPIFSSTPCIKQKAGIFFVMLIPIHMNQELSIIFEKEKIKKRANIERPSRPMAYLIYDVRGLLTLA